MWPLILLIIFIIHTVVFGWLFIRKRHLYQLIFTLGFICLIAFYSAKVMEKEIEALKWIRWGGFAMFAVATPMFIANVIRRIAARKKKPSKVS
ncbi:MAG: hypothetical protein HY811_12050 [Planctomycetes bacterium]|nr:hypothetical protein [Planctomycetota bacterium]